jgi:hypothetical protein
MAKDTQISTAAQNAAVDAITALLGGSGKLRFYDGTKPATANTALSGNNLLAEVALSASPFGAASAGAAALAGTPLDDISADATGTCTFASFVTGAGVRVWDVTVGVGATFNIQVATTSFVAGAIIRVTGYNLSIPAGSAT